MYLAGLFQGFAQAHPVNTLPFARVSLGLSEGEMSQLLAIARLGALAAVAFTLWGDRSGRRRPFLTAYALLMIAAASTALVPSPLGYGTMQFGARAAAAAVGVLATVLLAENLSPEVRGYGMAIYGASGSFGAGLATFVLPVADLGAEAWRFIFASSIVGLIVLPLLRRRLTEGTAFRTPPRRARLSDVVRPPSRRRFVPMAIISLTAAAFAAVGVSFSFERLVNDLGFSTATAVALSLGGGTLGGIGFPAGGHLADSWGRKPTALLALLASAAGGVGLYQLDGPLPLFVAIAVTSFGSFSAVPAFAALRTELFPTSYRATAVVWLNSIAIAGSVAGLAVGRLTIDRFGLPETVTALATASALAALLLLTLPETRRQPITALDR
jgi:MFS family permease